MRTLLGFSCLLPVLLAMAGAVAVVSTGPAKIDGTGSFDPLRWPTGAPAGKNHELEQHAPNLFDSNGRGSPTPRSECSMRRADLNTAR